MREAVLPRLLKNIPTTEIIYHIKQAKDAGLISTGPFYDAGESVHITDLTPAGHEFLANARTETVGINSNQWEYSLCQYL